ncbi:class I SAM-dependent methyltransferase [Natrialbaceae archaeon GCM10025810]|uniref:class I SAM-dependent methyltransferase n=1 Tax=Halovalidus salilacus TaxID=3075124 RepID=UPI00361320DD
MELDATDADFVCRRCDESVARLDGALRCPTCRVRIPVVDGIPRFPVPAAVSSGGDVFDRLAPIYETPVWFPPLYRFIGGPSAPRDDRLTVAELLDLEGESEGEGESVGEGEGESVGEGESDDEDEPGGDRDGLSILDVACGTGRFTRYVANDAAVAVGVDLSDGMLEKARRYAAREGIETAAFARMSADHLWFDDGAFDRAACCWALHIFPDVDAALEEIRRVLRPGGRFAGTTLVDEYVLGAPPVRLLANRTLNADPFAPEEFRDRLLTAGFDDLEFDRRGSVLFFGARAD